MGTRQDTPTGTATPPCPNGELGPLAIAQWAAWIARYWQFAGGGEATAAARGASAAPPTLLDLMPRSPATVLRLLRALREYGNPPPRYLACTPHGRLPPGWTDAPELTPWIAQGQIAPLAWDVGRRLPAWRPEGPVVVLARQAWQRLDQRLLAIHYGALLEGDRQRVAASEGDTGWTPVDARVWGASLDDTMASARAHLNSAPLPLPCGAMAAIDQLHALAPAGFLLLATDDGLASEQAIRLSNFGRIVIEYGTQGVLPVNFHFLAAHLRHAGAAVWQCGLGPTRIMQIAIAADGGRGAQSLLARVVAPPDDLAPIDTEGLAHAMRTVAAHGDGEQALALLRHARHDPAVLAAAGPMLHRRLLRQPGCEHDAWADALARVWDQHLVVPGETTLEDDAVSAALQIEAWPLARRMLRRCLAVPGRHAQPLAQLAWCEMRTGRMAQAQVLTAQALACDPRHAQAGEMARRLQARARRLDENWRRCLPHPRLPLVLEPLDIEHAESLLRQYRDPQIATMTGLPSMSDLGAVRAWIGDMSEQPDRHCYVAMHEDHGLVGYLSLHVSVSAANFCFWTGVDHQQRGFAREAGPLLCDFARTQGVRWVFASAFDDNFRSIRALEYIGFVRLGVRPASREDRRTFLCRLEPGARRDDACAELAAYMERDGANVQLEPDANEIHLIKENTA